MQTVAEKELMNQKIIGQLLSAIKVYFRNRILTPITIQSEKAVLLVSENDNDCIPNFYLQINLAESMFTLLFTIQMQTHFTNHRHSIVEIMNLSNQTRCNVVCYSYDFEKSIFYMKLILSSDIIYQLTMVSLNNYILSSLKEAEINIKQLLRKINEVIKVDPQPPKEDTTLAKPKIIIQNSEQAHKNEAHLKSFRKIIDKSIYQNRKCSQRMCKQSQEDEAKLENKIKKTNMGSAEKNFSKLCEINEKKKQKILRLIKFTQFSEDTSVTLEETNFSKVQKLNASFLIIEASLYQGSNDFDEDSNACQRYNNQEIIQKKSLTSEKSSFYTQTNILLYMRSSACQNIAEYYFEEIFENKQVPFIYSKYYPKHWNPVNHSPKKKLHTFLMLSWGLAFLQKIKLTHRDLKPENIMLDQKLSPKIIDFGSAVTHLDYSIRLTISYNLRTTKKYNLTFSDLNGEIKKFLSLDEFERHVNFDVYAFGVLFCCITEDKSCKQYFNPYIFENLEWIRQKCTEQNPNDRMSPQQLFGLVKYIWSCIKNG